MERRVDRFVIRRATREELPVILGMASEVFTREQGIPADDIDAFLAKGPICWCAAAGERIAAGVASWKEDGQTHCGRFFVIPSERRHRIGTALARFAFEDLFAMGVETIHMEARDTTVKIVVGMGGRVVGEPFPFFEGNVTPLVLEKKDYIKE